jgi:pimeloyl-ACP methyl ester carboxylesterase
MSGAFVMVRLRPIQFALLGLAVTICAAHAQDGFNAQEASCPKELPAQTRCYAGQDSNGAYYWIAIPKGWNNTLVVHTHGGPSLKTPSPDDPVADLKRFAVILDEGFAWAGSEYRHAGFGVRDAAADTDNLRKIFWAKFGRPKYTLLHGQSWGANVAAKTAEIYGIGASGKQIYDGVILTSGVLGGGTGSYDFRADLRAVYQYYCHNLPLSGEAPNSLWQNLGSDDKFKREDLIARVQDCTGINTPAVSRPPQQQRNLANLLAVIRIPERTLVSHMEWATFTFGDLVGRQLKGQNPFSNIGALYAGSDDDALLNKGVERFAATQTAVDALAFDADLSGKLVVPTLTLHAEDDPTAFVELENTYRDAVVRAGSQHFLVQSFTNEHEHLKEATPEYAALLRAMVAWIERGDKPTVQSLAAECEVAQKTYGEACHFDPGFYPKPLTMRVYTRIKPEPRRP